MIKFAAVLFLFCLVASARDVRSVRARSSLDDTQAIQQAIDACVPGDTVQFQPGTYLVRELTLRSNCSYEGMPGTTLVLATPNRFIFNISERSDIRIAGLTFDGNGIGGAIVAENYGPSARILIENCNFRNISAAAAYPANLTIVSTWGLIDSTIQNNHFENVSGGISLTTVQNVNLLSNSFVRVTQSDAIFVAPNPVSFPSGDNLRIVGNTGSRIQNIAIEIFQPSPPNGSSLNAPLIENNSFSEFTGTNGMGLSITHGNGAVIRGNRIDNLNGAMQAIGIEVIVDGAQVQNNVVSGAFAYGIAVQGTSNPTLIGNTVIGSGDTGIGLTCSNQYGRCASRNAVITKNAIKNARLVGIKLDNDWSGGLVSQNTITRTAGAWPDDASLLFSGVHQSPAPGPGTIDSNTIIQDAMDIVEGFWFCGVRINSQMPGSTIRNNVVRSLSDRPFGAGLIDNTGHATDGWAISGNQFFNVN